MGLGKGEPEEEAHRAVVVGSIDSGFWSFNIFCHFLAFLISAFRSIGLAMPAAMADVGREPYTAHIHPKPRHSEVEG